MSSASGFGSASTVSAVPPGRSRSCISCSGGLVAGILFVLPGFVAILALTLLYVGFRDVHAVEALLFGLKAGVLAVVLEAVLRIGRLIAGGPATFALAATAFVALFFFAVPFPLVVLAAGLFGLVLPGALPARARTRRRSRARHRPLPSSGFTAA